MIGNVLVDGDENIKAGAFGSIQEMVVLQASQFGEARGLAVVVWKQEPQSLVNALVDQKLH